MWGCEFCGAHGTPTTHHCERYDAWLAEREQQRPQITAEDVRRVWGIDV